MAQIIDAAFARDFLARLHASVNSHDAAAVAALCCEDVLWDDPAAPGPLHGREAVRRFHADTMLRALPDVRVEMIDGPYLALDRQGVSARLRISGTMTGPLVPPGFAPTNGPIVFETAEFSRFEGGLLSRHTVILDMLWARPADRCRATFRWAGRAHRLVGTACRGAPRTDRHTGSVTT